VPNEGPSATVTGASAAGYRLAELAERFGCELDGDGETRIVGVCSLHPGDPERLAFLADDRHRRFLAETRAGAVVLEPSHRRACPAPALVTTTPYLTYARLAALFAPEPEPAAGIDPTASIAASARVPGSAAIGAHAVLGEGVELGERVVVGPGTVVQQGATVGPDTRLMANVTICRGVRLGARGVVQPGAVLGADGFGFAPTGEGWEKVPQLGGVWLGDDVEIGANTTVDRGALEDTVIEDGVKLDNQVQVAHNVRIGAHTVAAALVGISGSAVIGRRCRLAGAVGVVDHVVIADDVLITGQTVVSRSIREPGSYSSGTALEPTRSWRRNAVRFRQLDEMARRLAALERKMADDD